MAWLLDTCVLIDLIRGDAKATKAVKRQRERPYVCAVSAMELYAGVRSQREEIRVDRLLDIFRSAPVAPSVYRHAGAILRHFEASHGIDIPDTLIAATAEHHGLALATLNVRHFPMFEGLKPAY